MDATYSGANIFTVAGDRTLEFVPDRRLKADCAASGIKYMTVLSSVYSTNTVVTTKESELTSNLTDVLYGILEPGELGSLPDHDHLGAEGSGGFLQIETTLSGLTDTPDDYGTLGDFLQSTGSGTQWALPNLTTISSDIYAWELVESGTYSAESFSITVSCNDGDVNDEWKVVIKDAKTAEVQLRYNGDSGNNYDYGVVYHDGSTPMAAVSVADRSRILLAAGARDGLCSISNLFLKNTGYKRVMTSIESFYNSGNADYTGLTLYGQWDNMVDKITFFEVYSGGTFTGTIEIYKKANIALILPARGKQSIKADYATTSGVYINPGEIEINNSLYSVTSQLTQEMPTLSGSTWYYIYAKEPTSGNVLTINEIEHTTIAPSEELEKMGYYHPTNSTWRCIGFVYSDSSSDIERYVVNGDDWKFSAWQAVLSTTTVTAPYLVDQRVPLGNLLVDCTTRARYNNVTGTDVFVYTGSSIAYKRYIGNIRTSDSDIAHSRVLECDSSKQIGIYASPSYDITCQMWTNGFKIPDLIYTGA